MKIKFYLVITIGIVLFISCNSLKKIGATENHRLSEFAENFVVAIKTENEKRIQELVDELNINQATVDFLISNNINYRGIPKKLPEDRNDLEKTVSIKSRETFQSNFTKIQEFIKRIKLDGNINGIELVAEPIETKFYNNELRYETKENGVEFIEFKIKIKNLNYVYEFSFSELLKLDNNWKSFGEWFWTSTIYE